MATDCELLLAGLLVLQHIASGARAARINGVLDVDVLNDSLPVNHKSGAIRDTFFLVIYPVILGNVSLEIAQEWKLDSDLFGESFVGGRTVYAHSQDLRAIRFEFGDISLIRLELFGSTTGESENIKRQHHIFLAQIIGQLHWLPVGVRQGEVRSFISHLQLRRPSCEWSGKRQNQQGRGTLYFLVHRIAS